MSNKKLEDTVVSLSSSIAPSRQHVYAKFGVDSKLRKNVLMHQQLKVQTAVRPRALNIYHMLRGVNAYLSMTVFWYLF